LVEKFPTVLEKLPQVIKGDFFDSHCRVSKAKPIGTFAAAELRQQVLFSICRMLFMLQNQQQLVNKL